MLPYIYSNSLEQGLENICQMSNLVITKLTSTICY